MYLSKRFLTKYIIFVFVVCAGTLLLFFPTSRVPNASSEAAPTDAPTHKTDCYILVIVLSTPRNSVNRALLRQNSYLAYPWMYNGTDIDFRFVFILGKSGDAEEDRNAEKESMEYKDVVIGNFKDSYSNLPQKVIWGFKYALMNFNFVYCIKVDEDSFVNMSYLAGYLGTVDKNKLDTFYAGKPRQGDLAAPKEGKFKVDTDVITEYVQYNLGGGYILSAPAMSRLLQTHRSGVIELLPWEDVYVGMLAHVSGIEPIRIYHYYVSKFYPFCTDAKSILLHHTPPELQVKMLVYFDRYGRYCPDKVPEEEAYKVIYSYDIVDWNEM